MLDTYGWGTGDGWAIATRGFAGALVAPAPAGGKGRLVFEDPPLPRAYTVRDSFPAEIVIIRPVSLKTSTPSPAALHISKPRKIALNPVIFIKKGKKTPVPAALSVKKQDTVRIPAEIRVATAHQHTHTPPITVRRRVRDLFPARLDHKITKQHVLDALVAATLDLDD